MSKSLTVLLGASVAICFVSGLVAAPTDPKADQVDVSQIERIAARDRTSATLYAQLAREQHAKNASRVLYNIVTDGGAACNGDVVTATRVTTIPRGTRILSDSVDTFTSGDV